MTVDLDTAPPGAAEPPPDRHRRTLLAGVAAIIVAIGAVGGFVWWDTHPNLIPPVGGSESAEVAVGRAIVEDAEVATLRGQDSGTITAHPDGGSTFTDTGNQHGYRVTIQSVHPNVVTNTSDATIRMELCTRNAAHVSIQPDGSKEYDLYCPSYEPVGHQKVTISDAPGSSLLAVVVTPHQPGVVRIKGFRVSYRQGIRRQTQTGGVDLTLRTR